MKSFRFFSRSRKDPDTLTARSMLLPILFCLVCGVLLILFGNLALRITAYVLAGVMILCGIWSVIAYIRSKPVRRITESRLATGLILLVAGGLLAFNPNYLEDILPFIWGLALLFGGFLKIQYAFDEKIRPGEPLVDNAHFCRLLRYCRHYFPAESLLPRRKPQSGHRDPSCF